MLFELSAPLSVVSVGSTRLRYVSFWRNNFTFSYEHGGQYVEPLAQTDDVIHGESTLFVQHLRHDAFGAKNWHQVFLTETVRLYQRPKDLNGRCIFDRVMFVIPFLDERGENLGVAFLLAVVGAPSYRGSSAHQRSGRIAPLT